MEPTTLCPDCNGELELGFVPDVTMFKALQLSWHRGTPDDKTFLEFLKYGPSVKYDRSQLLPIRAYRCQNCGLLRLFADET